MLPYIAFMKMASTLADSSGSTVGAYFRVLLPDTLQHLFRQVTGKYSGGVVELDQWNQNPHPGSNIQHYLARTQTGSRNDLA